MINIELEKIDIIYPSYGCNQVGKYYSTGIINRFCCSKTWIFWETMMNKYILSKKMSAPRVTDFYLENTESGTSLGSIRTSGLLQHTVFPRR